jgi:hypothetical protein
MIKFAGWFYRSLFGYPLPKVEQPIQQPVCDDLIDHGAISKETKGVFPYGNLYDGGAGYYWP